MAKQLNPLSGKGYLINMGQQAVESFLETRTQANLAAEANLYKGNSKIPNSGAISNILKELGWATFNGKEPAEKKNGPTVKAVAAFVPKQVAMLPARVEEFFVNALSWGDADNHTINTELTDITAIHVELVILSDTVKWNRLAMRLGDEERTMLGAFLNAGGFNPEPTLTDRAEKMRIVAIKAEQIEQDVQTALSALAYDGGGLANHLEKAIRAYYAG